MYLIFLDESGESKSEPYFVLVAVAIHASDIYDIYSAIRSGINNLNLPNIKAKMLGKGKEIKAKYVDEGEGYWRTNISARLEVLRIYLENDKVTYFIVCIDVERHKRKYKRPKDPRALAFRYLLERLQGFLQERNQLGLVLHDRYVHEEEKLPDINSLLNVGSEGIAKWYGKIYQWKLKIDNIVEIHIGGSEYSLGLQIADFVARYSYSWRKKGKDSNYPGWSYIEKHLYKYPEYEGWGYKEFPD